MEDRVNSAAGRYATVDGHDFGSGEMNIFVETSQPAEAGHSRDALGYRLGG